MVPFAGIAFLWFIGVVRDRIGEREDKFFATVFLGSGLLFVAMLFAAAAVLGGLIAGNRFGTAAPTDIATVGLRPLRRLLLPLRLRGQGGRRLHARHVDDRPALALAPLDVLQRFRRSRQC